MTNYLHLIRAALDATDLSTMERIVLICLIDHLPDARPSVALMMARTGLSRCSVLRATGALEKRRILVVERGPRGTGNRYVFRGDWTARISRLKRTPSGRIIRPEEVNNQSPTETTSASQECAQEMNNQSLTETRTSLSQRLELVSHRDPKEPSEGTNRRYKRARRSKTQPISEKSPVEKVDQKPRPNPKQKKPKLKPTPTPEQAIAASQRGELLGHYRTEFIRARKTPPVRGFSDGKDASRLIDSLGFEGAKQLLSCVFDDPWWSSRATIRTVANDPDKFTSLTKSVQMGASSTLIDSWTAPDSP